MTILRRAEKTGGVPFRKETSGKFASAGLHTNPEPFQTLAALVFLEGQSPKG
jgi:hypothetical protein